MATTRSNTTVRTNVMMRTMISLLGAVFTMLTKGLHWHMLYATMNSTAAMTGMGMKDAYGIKSTSTRSSTIECTMPATGLLPPLLMLAAVLAMAPVAGMPPNKAEPMLPMP